jgi:VanZ family protein
MGNDFRPTMIDSHSGRVLALLNPRLASRLISVVLIVYWCALFASTHLPPRMVVDTGVGDKTLHFSGYLGLSFLLACTVSAYRRPRFSTYVGMAFILFTYGALDEWSQMLVPGRHADFYDWVANAKGVIAGLILHRIAWNLYPCWAVGRSRILAACRRDR